MRQNCRPVAGLLLTDASPAVPPLRRLTNTIPIVFVLVADPVGLGFVQSLARPGGNITGFSTPDAPLNRSAVGTGRDTR
jgi:putative tryptophan/tyrosine transport system substrate-binding protein